MRSNIFTAVLSAVLLFHAISVEAASIKIVALGASNTYGSGRAASGGVRQSQAWPAQLQAMLRANGLSASVRNAGIPGDTTGGMLARLNRAVPPGTNLVILQPGGNDARRGQEGSRAANIAEIERRLAARGIKVLIMERPVQFAGRHTRDPDGQHFNAEGHANIARYFVGQVMAAVR